MEDIKIYDIQLDEADDMQGIQFISFVKDPAMEENFIALSKDVIELATQNDKQYVTGAVLIPNKLIPRKGNKALRFSADSIEKLRNKFHQTGSLQSTNIEHSTEMVNANLNESWIKTDDVNDKSVALGLGHLPVGTWFTQYHVPNGEDWNKYVLSKQCEGFSIEGILSHIEAALSKEEVTVDVTDDQLKSMIEDLLKMLN